MWNATILSYDYKNGMSYATVRFDNNNAQIASLTIQNFGDTFDKTMLNDWIYNKLQSLNKSEVSYASIQTVPPGPYVPIKPPDATPI